MADHTQLDHVAIGLRRLADAPPLAVGELGGSPLAGGPGLGFRWAQWRYAGGGVLEFLEPAGPPGGFLQRFLDARGPGIHHVTFKVRDLARHAKRAAALGYEVTGYDDSNPGWKECFLHPKQAQGIVVQMAESLSEPDASLDPAFAFPAGPPAAAPPARVVGLRLVARSAAAARRQWVELLGARCQEVRGELRLRWPDSPLRLFVEIDPGAEREGARHVEVTCARRLRLPDCFAQVDEEKET